MDILSNISRLVEKRQESHLVNYQKETFNEYLMQLYDENSCSITIYKDINNLHVYNECLIELLRDGFQSRFDGILFPLVLYYLNGQNTLDVSKVASFKKFETITPNIEKPLKTLYKSISTEMDGLFYHIEKVPERKPGFILHLLIIVPNKNYEDERKIYKEIGSLMRNFSNYLFDFSVVRRDGRQLSEISKGYEGYVYP